VSAEALGSLFAAHRKTKNLVVASGVYFASQDAAGQATGEAEWCPEASSRGDVSSRGDARAERANQGVDFRTPRAPGLGRKSQAVFFTYLLPIMSHQADATYLLHHVYRRQPVTGKISETAADNLRTIANTVADKSDDILNNLRYNKDGRRQVGYVGASISESSVQRANTAVPGLGTLAGLVMYKFDGTTFAKLFMYNSYEGLFPFHSDVLPANGERKIRVSISLST
jgi:hypothetical protein